jgi:hypothetical protein
MLRENATIVVARNERWQGDVATEPVECGWASEAIFFIRSLGGPLGAPVEARVEISPDGMHWTAAGVAEPLPATPAEVTALRVAHFGNWLRLTATIPEGEPFVSLVTLHLK